MEDLMLKSYWSLEDIKSYLNCGTTTASHIRQKALKVGGGCPYLSNLIKRDSVLKILELDPARELEIYKLYWQAHVETKD